MLRVIWRVFIEELFDELRKELSDELGDALFDELCCERCDEITLRGIENRSWKCCSRPAASRSNFQTSATVF